MSHFSIDIEDYRKEVEERAKKCSNEELLDEAYWADGDIGTGSGAYLHSMVQIDNQVYRGELKRRLIEIGFLES